MSRLLTIEQVAELLNCSRRTVERRIGQGLIPAVREGGRTMVTETELEHYIAGLRRRRVA